MRTCNSAAPCYSTSASPLRKFPVTLGQIPHFTFTDASSFHSASLRFQQKPSQADDEPSANSPVGPSIKEADLTTANDIPDGTKLVLYKGRYMQTFRLLVRFKIFQLVGIAALAIPINTFLVEVSSRPLLFFVCEQLTREQTHITNLRFVIVEREK